MKDRINLATPQDIPPYSPVVLCKLEVEVRTFRAANLRAFFDDHGVTPKNPL